MVGKLTSNEKASASVIPAIMGVSNYTTPSEQLRKCLDAIAGKPDDFKGNEAMDWGNRLEAIGLEVAADRLGCSRIVTEITTPYIHPDIPLECSVDAIAEFDEETEIYTDPSKGIFVVGADSITVKGAGCGENKITSVMPESQPHLARGPLQLQAQMMCTGLNWGFICVLYRGIEMRIFLYRAHPQTMTAIKDAVIDFDRRIYSNPTDWYDINSSEDVIAMFPEVESEDPIDLDADTIKLLHEYAALQETVAAADDTLKSMQIHFQKVMGNSSLATGDGFTLKWPMRNTRAQPEKVVPAKPATSKRQSKVSIKLPKGEINVPSNS